MFYIEQDNKIVLFDEDLVRLQNTIEFMPQYAGLEIRETDRPIVDFQFADTEEYISKTLADAKTAKYKEANEGAKAYLESGNALYELEEGKHIEATDGNIAKLSAYALSFVTGALSADDTVSWNTKEDETVQLNQQELSQVLTGIGQVQSQVWTVKFPAYVAQIEAASTADEVEAIIIDYAKELEDVEGNTESNSEVVENDV